MTRRRRHVELPPRRREEPTHAHTDSCQLSTFENGEIVTYRGVKAVTSWLNRVADLARERGGYVRSGEGASEAASSPVRAPAHRFRAPILPRAASAESDPSVHHVRREDPPAPPILDRLGF